MNPRYSIGQQFTVRRKGFQRDYTVVDIYTTRNAAGEAVKLEYLTTHPMMGQAVRELVCETTIARALWDADHNIVWSPKTARMQRGGTVGS